MTKTPTDLTRAILAQATTSQRAGCIQAAEIYARDVVARRAALLDEAGGDLNKVAPPPNGNMSRERYMAAKRNQNAYEAITKAAPGHRTSYRDNEPRIVVICPNRVERMVERAKEDARAAFDAFLGKLAQKIGGGIEAAALTDGDPWNRSTLTVTHAEGTETRWRTTAIWNVSKLGLVFPQFPTRKVK